MKKQMELFFIPLKERTRRYGAIGGRHAGEKTIC